MKYENIVEACFINRPNRFIANILVDGKEQVCHVKNTGRCKELLAGNPTIYVQHFDSASRKTAYDLIAVQKGHRLINMDSVAPNKVFGEYLAAGGMGFVPEYIKAEATHGDSRFDFYFEHNDKKAFAEVKGVTLEEDGIVRFPDAPTERGLKHLRGLIECVQQGFEAYAVFIIQMDNVKHFEPNYKTHKEFGLLLKEAQEKGVKLLALDCKVKPDELLAGDAVEIKL